MGDPKIAKQIVEAVVDSVDCPVTVKMRTGISKQKINAVSLAQEFEKCGVKQLQFMAELKAVLIKSLLSTLR